MNTKKILIILVPHILSLDIDALGDCFPVNVQSVFSDKERAGKLNEILQDCPFIISIYE